MPGFLLEFVKKPFMTGALGPSSDELTKKVITRARLKDARQVVELGSGDGVITERILSQLSKSASFFALELNPDFARKTKKRCPGVTVYVDNAANLRKYLKKYNSISCDRIISTLPWSAFRKEVQDNILNCIHSSLEKGGIFLTVSYKHSLLFPMGRRFKKRLSQTFSRVERTPLVWKNFPPAFVYVCRK